MPISSVWSDPLEKWAFTSSVTFRGKDWVRTPGYASIPRPDLPVNPYNDTQRSWKQGLWAGWTRIRISNGAASTVVNPGYSYYVNDIMLLLEQEYVASGVASLFAASQNRAMLKALSRVADTKSNVAVSLAEASKTSTLILDTAKRIFKAWVAFRRGNFVETARQLNLTPKTIHSNWLAYKYGWMPLVSEIRGAAEFFAQRLVTGRALQFSSKGSDTFSVSRNAIYPNTIAGGAPWNLHLDTRVEVETKVEIWCELTSPHLSAAQQIGITNPALYVWEVIPFSFVFDWFISVGDYLTGLTALNGVTVRKALVSTTDSSLMLGSIDAVSNFSDGTYLNTLGERSFVDVRRNYTRSSVNVNPLSLYPPINPFPTSLSKMVTGLALMRGVVSGMPKGVR